MKITINTYFINTIIITIISLLTPLLPQNKDSKPERLQGVLYHPEGTEDKLDQVKL